METVKRRGRDSMRTHVGAPQAGGRRRTGGNAPARCGSVKTARDAAMHRRDQMMLERHLPTDAQGRPQEDKVTGR